MADHAGLATVAVAVHGCEYLFRILRTGERQQFPLIRQIQRIKAQDIAYTLHLRPDGQCILLEQDTGTRLLGNLIERGRDASTRRIAQHRNLRRCREHRLRKPIERRAVTLNLRRQFQPMACGHDCG